ncbi:hypothetical protein DRO56_03690 [Candidatus Bathyarchaeota archaeon]|nr:MAG: hypothetical protein DRO56_03690 [Candidatus Bathyarchaeota archaeon]
MKVKLATTIYKTRRLPVPGEVLVGMGDSVSYDTIVARAFIRGDPEVVKVSTLLGVEPEELPEYMYKRVGDRVKKDEVIAGYTALFGLIKKRATSPIDGTIESISTATGQIVIRGLPVPVEVDAYIPGEVVEVLPREGVVVKTNAAFVQGIFGIGGETHGRIRIAVDSPEEELTADHVTSEDKGAILIGGSLVTLDALRRGVEVGVSCIVAGGIHHKDLKEFMGEEIGVAITGQEEVGLTLIITEGFGRMRMSRRTFNLLKRFEGYMAAANGATQIRAGVIRPEIIIPHEEHYEETSGDELAAGMIPGTPIRIIREPYFGAIGRVISLPVELQQIQTRSYVRVVEVELEDGRVVIVPRANVEIIEE